MSDNPMDILEASKLADAEKRKVALLFTDFKQWDASKQTAERKRLASIFAAWGTVGQA